MSRPALYSGLSELMSLDFVIIIIEQQRIKVSDCIILFYIYFLILGPFPTWTRGDYWSRFHD